MHLKFILDNHKSREVSKPVIPAEDDINHRHSAGLVRYWLILAYTHDSLQNHGFEGQVSLQIETYHYYKSWNSGMKNTNTVDVQECCKYMMTEVSDMVCELSGNICRQTTKYIFFQSINKNKVGSLDRKSVV